MHIADSRTPMAPHLAPTLPPLRSTDVAPNCAQYLQQMAGLGILVGDFYLQLGIARAGSALPGDLTLGAPRQCYDNAGNLALERGWAYCEGFAMRPGLFPMHHAWCLDAVGAVVDPTWPYDPANEYLGVALDESFLVLHRERTGHWDVLSERLADFVIEQQPGSYLHPQWAPDSHQQTAFWQVLQARLNKTSS